ncbi:AAR2 protein-domain-containing protein [Aspergillus oleicola]
MDDDDIPGLEDPASASEGQNEPTSFGPTSETQSRPEQIIERNFSFLPIDLKQTWRVGAIGRERTEAARDKSYALGEIIHSISTSTSSPLSSSASGESQILGELQFTFLMGLTLMNFSCFQQWKRLLRLILTCRAAILTRANLISSVLRLLLTQLKRCDDVEGGLFDQMGNEGGAEGGEFIRKLLRGFRRAMYEVLADEDGEQNQSGSVSESPVKKEFEKLEEWVKNEFDWELDRDKVLRRGMVQLEDGEEVELEIDDHEEEEEYQPVVVDLGGDMDEDMDEDEDDGDMRF